MDSLQEFFAAVQTEETRVKQVLKTHTLQGNIAARAIWEKHFEQTYVHGINTIYDIARVNVIHRAKGKALLC